MKKSILLIALIFSNFTFSQVGINTTNPESSLDVRAENHLGMVSATDGILVPRVNDLSVSGSTNGQLVFLIAENQDFDQGFYYWYNTRWINILASDWAINGNSTTTNGRHFIGTTNTQDLDIRTDNVIRHRFTQKGQLEFLNSGESILIGENAGENQLTNNTIHNIFIGNNTGMVNDDNLGLYIGHRSGEQTTSGPDNIFIGAFSGQNNTTGGFNTFLGSFSGFNNINGGNCAFFGTESGYSNTDGQRNSFFGDSSGYSNTTGNFNSFFGTDSGYSNTTGSENVFFGNDSGYNNTTGNKNSFYGTESGFSNTNGNANLFLGYQSGYFETGSHRLYIENSDSNTPLIGGDFNLDRVGINRSINDLTNTFEVEGDASKATVGLWLGNSDKRLKKDIESISGEKALEILNKLRGVTYEWNDMRTTYQRPEGLQYGFVAQELMQVFPERVNKDAQGFYQTAYSDYDAFFVQALKQLQYEISEKNTKLNILKAENKIALDQNSKLLSELDKLKKEINSMKQSSKK